MTLFVLAFFVWVIVYADRFSKGSEAVYVSSVFVETDDTPSETIDLNSIDIELTNNNQSLIHYVVQNGDSLGKISRMFWTTISHIRQINGLSSDDSIRPGQKLIITEDEGIIYTVKEKTNALIFANTYNLNPDDLITLNSLSDISEVLWEGQELFLNISNEQAYDLGLLERPKPVFKPESEITYKPTINKPSKVKKITSDGDDDTSAQYFKWAKVISKWTFNKKINNKFSMGHCTWYIAATTPQIFPYIDDDTQARPFGGNGNEWYANASKAGFSVGQKPVVGSIVVYIRGFRWSGAGHVAKVISIDGENMVVEDMNWAGKFIVTRHTESTKNGNIKWYIYMPKTPRKPS